MNLGQSHSVLAMVLDAGPVVFSVLVILALLSVWSWTITIAKTFQFRRAVNESKEFSSIFWETRNLTRIDDSSQRLSASPLAQVFVSGYRELSHLISAREESEGKEKKSGDAARGEDLSSLEMALKRAEFEEALKLERGTTFLATVASAAPFIGLFGTVWGIMNAFQGLSNAQNTTIQAVAPGISEALVATAIGLVAAIPAAVAYNYFAVSIRHFKESMDRFSSEFMNVAEKHFV